MESFAPQSVFISLLFLIQIDFSTYTCLVGHFNWIKEHFLLLPYASITKTVQRLNEFFLSSAAVDVWWSCQRGQGGADAHDIMTTPRFKTGNQFETSYDHHICLV